MWSSAAYQHMWSSGDGEELDGHGGGVEYVVVVNLLLFIVYDDDGGDGAEQEITLCRVVTLNW